MFYRGAGRPRGQNLCRSGAGRSAGEISESYPCNICPCVTCEHIVALGGGSPAKPDPVDYERSVVETTLSCHLCGLINVVLQTLIKKTHRKL